MAASAKKKKTAWEHFIEFVGILTLVFLIRTFGFGLYQVPTGSMETSMLVGERFFADKLSYVFRNPSQGEVIAFNQPPSSFDYSKNWFMNLFQKYVYGPCNFTKRVIAVPGDTVQGIVENGKAVIYINGKKLHEPYLNKYPLLTVYKEHPAEIERQLNAEFQPFVWQGVDPQQIAQLKNRKKREFISQKSFDPHKLFENQPFYRINPSHVHYTPDGLLDLTHQTDGIKSGSEGRMNFCNDGSGNYCDGSDEFFVKLGPNQYWVMGDNRKGSHDSRFFGPIPRDLIHGHILFRIWSVDSDEAWWILDLLKHPIDFWTRVRWGRFFQWIY